MEDYTASAEKVRQLARKRLAGMDTTTVSTHLWPQLRLGDTMQVVGIETHDDGTTTYTMARVSTSDTPSTASTDSGSSERPRRPRADAP